MSKNVYFVPNSIKLVGGTFAYGETVTLNVDGKEIKRKVNYSTLSGLYVVISGVKYGKTDLDK